MKMLGKNVEQKDDDEKIKGVESPAEKAGGNSVPSIGGLQLN